METNDVITVQYSLDEWKFSEEDPHFLAARGAELAIGWEHGISSRALEDAMTEENVLAVIHHTDAWAFADTDDTLEAAKAWLEERLPGAHKEAVRDVVAAAVPAEWEAAAKLREASANGVEDDVSGILDVWRKKGPESLLMVLLGFDDEGRTALHVAKNKAVVETLLRDPAVRPQLLAAVDIDKCVAAAGFAERIDDAETAECLGKVLSLDPGAVVRARGRAGVLPLAAWLPAPWTVPFEEIEGILELDARGAWRAVNEAMSAYRGTLEKLGAGAPVDISVN